MKYVEGNCVGNAGVPETVRMTINNGRIQSIHKYSNVDHSLPTILPGFIDVHVHGGGGADTMDATMEAFDTITTTHAGFGTTSLLLTTVTDSVEHIQKVLQVAQKYMSEAGAGATALGVHLEGPFIHPRKAGAQRQDSIIDPNPELANTWFETGIVRMITMAPERPLAHDVARLAAAKDIISSVGHTEATADDVRLAKAAGFSHVTHLCNAMRPLYHRDVGPIGHVVDDENYTGDLICDGVHLDGPMVKALVRSIGIGRLLLITDAIRATAVGPGTYESGGLTVHVTDGVCRLENGTLAGSVLTMAKAVDLVQQFAGISLFDAQRMASENPAKKLHLETKGKIEVGYDADLVCVDQSCVPIWTMVGGRIVYER